MYFRLINFGMVNYTRLQSELMYNIYTLNYIDVYSSFDMSGYCQYQSFT